MSDDRDFEQFIRSAKAPRHATEDDAQRVERNLSSHVAWKRALPSAVAAALLSTITPSAAACTASPPKRSWPKMVGIALPVIGLSLASYSVATKPAPVFEPRVAASVATVAAPILTAAPSISAPSKSGESDDVLTVADPSQLPTAKPEAPSGKPSASSGDSVRESTLGAELALLAKTSAALQAREPARALALADTHDCTFPRGVLGPEFAAQRILALTALGRRAEACAQATRFLAANPSSPLAPQVRSSCDATN